jgi:hypothetical protein
MGIDSLYSVLNWLPAFTAAVFHVRFGAVPIVVFSCVEGFVVRFAHEFAV